MKEFWTIYLINWLIVFAALFVIYKTRKRDDDWRPPPGDTPPDEPPEPPDDPSDTLDWDKVEKALHKPFRHKKKKKPTNV